MTTTPVKRMADDSTQCRRIVYRIYKELDPEFFDYVTGFSNSGLNKLAFTLLHDHWQQLKAAGRQPQLVSSLTPTAAPAPAAAAPVPAPAPVATPAATVVAEQPAPSVRSEPAPKVPPQPAVKSETSGRQPREEAKAPVRPASAPNTPPAVSTQPVPTPAPPAPANTKEPIATASREVVTPAPAAEPPSIELGPMTPPAAANRPAGPKSMSAARRQAWLRTGE